MEASREILEMIKMIENQQRLSDYGENTHELDELYYHFFELVSDRVAESND